MSLIFPSNPEIGTVFPEGAVKQWQWNGQTWDLLSVTESQVQRAEDAAVVATTKAGDASQSALDAQEAASNAETVATTKVGELKDDLASVGSSKGAELVGFKQIGVDAVERTLADKARETVSVKDFGAVGDGVTDDTAAIQAAADFVNALGGGEIRFPVGSYFLSAPITLGSNTAVTGAGTGATVIHHPTSHAFRNKGRDAGGNEGITIRSISFDAGETFDGAVSFVGIRRGHFSDLDIRGIKPIDVTVGIGISAAPGNPSKNIVFNNISIDAPDYGVVLDSGVGGEISSVVFSGCNIETAWGSCISLARNVDRVTILGGNITIRGDSPTFPDVGIGVKMWDGESYGSGPRNVTLSAINFTGADSRTNLVGVSAANYTTDVTITGCTFKKLTSAFHNDYAGSDQCTFSFSGNVVEDGDFGYYSSVSSDSKRVITGNSFRNLICAIQTSLTKSIVSGNRFENILEKAIVVELGYFSTISDNMFSNIGQEAIYFYRNGVDNTLCSITGNVFDECCVAEDDLHPVIWLNDQSHSVCNNIMRNQGVNKPSWIIGRHASSNNCVFTSNWMFGARQGYKQIENAGDVYENNRERGGIG